MHHCSRSHGRARLYFYTSFSCRCSLTLLAIIAEQTAIRPYILKRPKTKEIPTGVQSQSKAEKGREPNFTYATMTTSSAKAGLRWYAALSPAAHALACHAPPHTHTAPSSFSTRSGARNTAAEAVGPARPIWSERTRERERESKGRDPHGDGVRGGAGRRGGVQVPQQDPLPVDGLLHCLTPFLGCSLLVTTCCRRHFRPRGWSGVICRRGGDCRGGWGREIAEVLPRSIGADEDEWTTDGKPETRPGAGGMGTGGVSRGGPARQRRLGLGLLLRYCVSA